MKPYEFLRLKRDKSIRSHSRVAKNAGNASASHIAKKNISVVKRVAMMQKRDDINLSRTVDHKR